MIGGAPEDFLLDAGLERPGDVGRPRAHVHLLRPDEDQGARGCGDLAAIEQGIEHGAERARGLSAPLRLERQEHDVALALLDVERRGLVLQVLGAIQES